MCGVKGSLRSTDTGTIQRRCPRDCCLTCAACEDIATPGRSSVHFSAAAASVSCKNCPLFNYYDTRKSRAACPHTTWGVASLVQAETNGVSWEARAFG